MSKERSLRLIKLLTLAAAVVVLAMWAVNRTEGTGASAPVPSLEPAEAPGEQPAETSAPAPGDEAEGPEAQPATAENPFLTMEILDLYEQPFDAASLEGMPLMLNFWASWCGPCVSEMPHLSELSQEYAGKIRILGVLSDSVTEGEDGKPVLNRKEIDGARAFYEKAKIAYPSLIANDLMLGVMYQLQMTGIPTTLFIDQNGYLRVQPIVGSRDKDSWKQLIDRFLEDLEAAPAPPEGGDA